MTDMEKEYLLHKILAASAFLFALCILPVAQYLLVSNRLEEPGIVGVEQGQVAGVSTEDANTTGQVVRAGVAAPINPDESVEEGTCSPALAEEVAQLERWTTGKKAAMLAAYEASVKPYQEVVPTLRGSAEYIASETAALNRLIDAEYQPYLKKVAEVDRAVESQKKLLVSKFCRTE